ncbi:MAG: tungstate ABC transporter substrate-binding protein WtpA [Dehalococcoidia bacterium]
MKSKLLEILAVTVALILILTMAVGCGDDDEESPATLPEDTSSELKGTLTIFHAGSLAVPFSEMEVEFESMYPGVDVQCESASSGVTIRKVTELGKNAEIIASADYSLIPALMYPDYADWHVTFAKNRMVLCYTDRSEYANEVNTDNWYQILLRDGVEHGHSDLLDPCGYRTLLVWQLAEEYYGEPGLYEDLVASCPEKNIRPKSVELVALLQSGDLDYASEYSSVAMQHNLNYVEYPTEIDLSAVEHKDFYAQSSIEVPGKEPGETITQIGKPIVYGVTIPANTENPELAIAFMEYLLGEKGQSIMNSNGQPSIVPAVADDLGNLPSELQPLAGQSQ